jgi:hypothetical protein
MGSTNDPPAHHSPDVIVAIEGREKSAHVRGENDKQRHAPQYINEKDAL